VQKLPDFGLAPAAAAWSQGLDFSELENYTSSTPGDIVRTFRMAIQMMRQLGQTLSEGYPLRDRLSEAIVAMNRDVVDAKLQLELG
jgi:superfamily II RNA helicase